MSAWLGWLVAPNDTLAAAERQKATFLNAPFPDGSTFEDIVISGDIPELMVRLLALAETGATEIRLVTMTMENEGLEAYKSLFAPIRLFQARFPGVRVGVYAPFMLSNHCAVADLHNHLAQ